MSVGDPLSPAVLQAICSILGDSVTGLTAGEIAEALAGGTMPDPTPRAPAAKRLFGALWAAQAGPGGVQRTLHFVEAAMLRLRERHGRFGIAMERIEARLELVLRTAGYRLSEGRIVPRERLAAESPTSH